ncbi:CRISPR-associated helicase Cas3' [Candidatus Micrarchaeota archaeon]|nr:CRISPR-associated helicase Cas3' [Candidatus Micrarchaeota archaeon]
MTTSSYISFEDFFEKTTGKKPFPYQRQLASSAEFPEVLNVPTGAGKTAAAVLAWLWRRRFSGSSIRASTPRRLVYCLPMRVLVEQTREESRQWLKNLDLLAETPGSGEDNIAVTVLMGGESKDEWDEYPEHDAILIGTQDMLLSRALNRGYGMSRNRWPIHYALLNNDCLWVMDEVQLMGVGVETSAQMQAMRLKLGCMKPAHTLWMSATVDRNRMTTFDHPAPEMEGVLVLGDEDKGQPNLKKRLDAIKPLKKLHVTIDDKDYFSKVAKILVDGHSNGTLSLAVVNTVERARRLFCEVKNRVDASQSGIHVILIHSRFRPEDRKENIEWLVGKNNAGKSRVVVATQVVEAGVDVSAAKLFTEIASWPSLVQRFGRCNRYGECDDIAEVMWADASNALDSDNGRGKTDFHAPYLPLEVDSARKLLAKLNDVGINSLEEASRDFKPSQMECQVIRWRDVVDLFDTTPDLTGNDLDVSRFIRETGDTDVQIFWKKNVDEKSDYIEPVREELCSVPIGDVRRLLGKPKGAEGDESKEKPKPRKNAFTGFLRWNPLEEKFERVKDPRLLAPGQILLLGCKDGGYNKIIGWDTELVGRNKVEEWQPKNTSGGEDARTDVDSHDSDPLTYIGKAVLLETHLIDIEKEAALLADAIGLEPDKADAIKTSARWHDVGKSHPVFQGMLRNVNPDLDASQLWAKSKGKGGKYERKHFRHELASALAWLQNGASGQANADLIAYLIAAHHGKVRLSLRSLPGESQPDDGMRMVRGIKDGDELPPVPPMLPSGVKLDLSPMELGEGSWLERTLALRDDPNMGPFRLGFYEMLLRIADWKASKKERLE